MAEEFKRKPGTERFTTLEPVVMAYPHVIKPKAFKRDGKEQGKPRFTANLLFKPDSEELKAIKALWAKIIEEKWPGRLAKEAKERKAAAAAGLPVPGGHLRLPFSVGDKLADENAAEGKPKEFYRGFIMIPVHADEEHPPRLCGFVNGAMTNYDEEAVKLYAKQFYHGVEVLTQLNFVAYIGAGKGETKSPDGVTAYLNMVLSTNKGKKLPGGGTGPNPADVFKGYRGNASTEDPTAGQFDTGGDEDDGIPF